MHPTYGELRPVTPLASVLLEPNPSPMTLEGTNTYVLRRPDSAGAIVVDPGPLDAKHLTVVAEHGPDLVEFRGEHDQRLVGGRTELPAQGIAHRLIGGNAASSDAAEISANIRPLAAAAWQFVDAD